MTAAPFFPCAPDADKRDAYVQIDRAIDTAAGGAPSVATAALATAVRRAFLNALCRPDSRKAWTLFVRAVAAYLEDLDGAVGFARDGAATASRSELREILIVNDDLLGDESCAPATR